MKVFKKSSIVKEQEIYACMLHGLFDEYRFLHKYPPQFLEKIAKLFGAVIKNKLLDLVLQDIAFKFVSDAFRRDGKRQNFGIIIIRDIKHQLKDYPKFFQDIYNYRDKIKTKEPGLYADIGRLYTEYLESATQATESASNPGMPDSRTSPRLDTSINTADDIFNIDHGDSSANEDPSINVNLKHLDLDKVAHDKKNPSDKKQDQRQDKNVQAQKNKQDPAQNPQAQAQYHKSAAGKREEQKHQRQTAERFTTNSTSFVPSNYDPQGQQPTLEPAAGK
jgi:hypothetical protein